MTTLLPDNALHRLNVRRLLIVASLLLTSTSAWCCMCVTPNAVDGESPLDRRIRATALIFHARVTSVRPDRSAEVDVVEEFKGRAPKILRAKPPNSVCGTSFKVGEERVFFLNSDRVSACDKHSVTPELIEMLRRRNNGAL
jgi:hypothetical protein